MADVIFALAFSRVIFRFHSVLVSENLTSTIVGDDATTLELAEVVYCDDTFFPVMDREAWEEVSRTPGQTPGVSFVELHHCD